MEEEGVISSKSCVLKILVGPLSLPTDILVTPASTFEDILDSVKENGAADEAVVVERWNGCERPVGRDEHPFELLQQWGNSQDEVKYILKRPAPFSKKAVSPNRCTLSPRKSPYRRCGERFSRSSPARGRCPLSPHCSAPASPLRLSNSPRCKAAVSPKAEVRRLCIRLNECHEQNSRSVAEVQKLREMCAEHERQILRYQQNMQDMRDRLARCRQLAVRHKALKGLPSGERMPSLTDLKGKKAHLQKELRLCQQEQRALSNEIHSRSEVYRKKVDRHASVRLSIEQAERELVAEESKQLPISEDYGKTGDASHQPASEPDMSTPDGSLVSRIQTTGIVDISATSEKGDEASLQTTSDNSHFDDVMQIESISFNRRNSCRRLSGEFMRGKNRWSIGARLSPSLGAISSVLEEEGQLKSVGRSHSDTAIAQLQRDQNEEKVQYSHSCTAAASPERAPSFEHCQSEPSLMPDSVVFLQHESTPETSIVRSPVDSPSTAQPSIVPLSPSSLDSPSILPVLLTCSPSPDRTPSPENQFQVIADKEQEAMDDRHGNTLGNLSPASGQAITTTYLPKERPDHVRFEPIIVLLDSALEGDLEQVQISAKEVPHISCCASDGITALHNAVCGGSNDVVRYLVEGGADVNAFDENGWTPLHCAGSCANEDAVYILVNNGAALLHENDEGQTAHGVAVASLEKEQEEDDDNADVDNPCIAILQDMQGRLGSADDGLTYAAFSYRSDADDELEFSAGERLCILRKGDENESSWWWAQDQNGHTGYVPCTYLSLCPKAVAKV